MIIFRCDLADSVVRRFSGDGSFGYSDGDVGSAQFNKPKSFAVDFRGNVYVADRSNHVIRKISSSGICVQAFLFLSVVVLFVVSFGVKGTKGEDLLLWTA